MNEQELEEFAACLDEPDVVLAPEARQFCTVIIAEVRRLTAENEKLTKEREDEKTLQTELLQRHHDALDLLQRLNIDVDSLTKERYALAESHICAPCQVFGCNKQREDHNSIFETVVCGEYPHKTHAQCWLEWARQQVERGEAT